METEDINNTHHIKEKGNGFLGYMAMFAGFILVLVLIAKGITWLMK
jgi:hypothetical protein